MAAPAFGFSFGDIVAAGQLIAKAVAALRQSSGAAWNYQQTALELKGLQSVLKRLQSLRPNSTNRETIEQIKVCALTCQLPLAHFIKKTETFAGHLTPAAQLQPRRFGGKLIATTGRKLQWALCVKDEVEKLKASIAGR